MKKFLVGSLMLLGCSALAAEEVKFVNADGSRLSQLCIAALESEEAMRSLASNLGLEEIDQDTLACNGIPLPSFVRMYKVGEQPPQSYGFSKGDSSLETELCYAAVTSRQYFQALKQKYFSPDDKIEEKILCNNQPLGRFARKYTSNELTAAL